ncbi:MAG: hypothetical protein Q4G36_09715 [Paracoccus sp. (in: a-proteobacteria)]|nr:hypothetical protein [Paracoccus sp. (in: a-proteobacteria)]
MAPVLKTEHELHGRRRGRNIGLALVLLGFIALVFGLTVVKIQGGASMEAFDHQPRSSILPPDANPPPRNPAPVAAPGTPAADQGATTTAPQPTGAADASR